MKIYTEEWLGVVSTNLSSGMVNHIYSLGNVNYTFQKIVLLTQTVILKQIELDKKVNSESSVYQRYSMTGISNLIKEKDKRLTEVYLNALLDLGYLSYGETPFIDNKTSLKEEVWCIWIDVGKFSIDLSIYKRNHPKKLGWFSEKLLLISGATI